MRVVGQNVQPTDLALQIRSLGVSYGVPLNSAKSHSGMVNATLEKERQTTLGGTYSLRARRFSSIFSEIRLSEKVILYKKLKQPTRKLILSKIYAEK